MNHAALALEVAEKAHYVDGVPYGSECIKLVKRDLVKR
jgi:hypothetical protein